jgi:hypothetical protein
MTMYGPGGPDPEFLAWKARYRAQQRSQKIAAQRARIRDNPNRFFVGDILGLAIPAVSIGAGATLLVIASIFVAPILADWFRSLGGVTVATGVAGAALVLGIGAWYAREKKQFKLYPVAEIAFGLALAVQGIVQQKLSGVSLLAALIAFVGGVRIIIDGVKRFDEFGTKWFFTVHGIRFVWRFWKRRMRDFRYDG